MFGVRTRLRLILLFLFVPSLCSLLLDPEGQWLEENSPSILDRGLIARSIAKTDPLRILCLGASITYGYHSSDGNGYRYALRGKLTQQGNDVNMIGSVRAGNMSNNRVEGWPGYRIGQVAKKAELSLPEMPNVVLLFVGLNDLIQNYEVSTAHLRMGQLIDRILEVVSGTTVIVGTLLPNAVPSVEDKIRTFNANLPGVVSNRTMQGKKVSLVDMHSDWFSVADLGPDGIHPTDMGYLKMAKVFYTGIVAAAANISAPAAVKGIDDYSAGNDSSIADTAMDVVCQPVTGQTMGVAQKQQCSSSTRVHAREICLVFAIMVVSAYI